MDMKDCMAEEEIGIAMLDAEYIGMLSELMICLATDQSRGTERLAVILVIQRCNCKHRWHCNERKKNNNTCGATRQDTETAATEPCMNGEDIPAGNSGNPR